jgi:hypothetical protein
MYRLRTILKHAATARDGGGVLGTASMMGSPDRLVVREWKLEAYRSGRRVVSAYWWELTAVVCNERSVQILRWDRYWEVAAQSVYVADAINARMSDLAIKQRYNAAVAAAVERDRQELEARKTGKPALSAWLRTLTPAEREAFARYGSRRNAISGCIVGLVAVAAGIGGVAVTESTTPSYIVPSNREPAADFGSGHCNTTSDGFVKHDHSMDPAGVSAQSVRAGGYLVTSDGAGGSCVFEDRPLGG